MILFLKIKILFLICFLSFGFESPIKPNKDETLSWSFQNISNNKENYDLNSDQKSIPASILKVVSMSYALDSLGPNFTFKTKVFYDGKIKKEVLYGNIYIVGGSDPYIQHPQLINIAKSISRLGITKVTGALIYDISSYPEQHKISELGFGDQTYNPSFGPLNSVFNRHSLWKRKKNDYVSIIPELEIELTSSSKLLPTQKFEWKRDTKKESWEFSKKNNFKQREDIPIRNAALWTTKLLKLHLESLGVKIDNIKKGTLPKRSKHIFTSESLPLYSLVSLTMEYSNNLLAEAISMKACQKKSVSPLTQSTCAKKIEKYFVGITGEKSVFVNASGLSTYNLVSAKGLSIFIKEISKKNWKGHTLESFLSISGQSGWMRNRLNSPNYNMRVFAKTGSLDFINNITGLLRTKKNEWFSFTILHSDDEKRAILDSKKESKLKQLKNEAKSWRKRSLNKTNLLIQSFIDQN